MRVWIRHEGDSYRSEYDADEVIVDTPATISVEYSQLVIKHEEAEEVSE